MTENSLIMFKCEGQEFPMEIIDQKGDSWVTRKQLAEALGVKDLDPLHRRLSERGELKERTHWERLTVDATVNPKGGRPDIIVYSYRGIIRVAMASEGKRAVAFRDWAEDVLYEVMVRGSYSRKDYSYADELDRRTKAIRSELKALKADNAFRMQAEREALKVRRGGKSLDDLNGYPNLREKVVKVMETQRQNKEADSIIRFWNDRLMNCESCNFWGSWIPSAFLWAEYKAFCDENKDVSIADSDSFFKRIKVLFPKIKRERRCKKRHRGYVLPAHDVCMNDFEAYMRA